MMSLDVLNPFGTPVPTPHREAPMPSTRTDATKVNDANEGFLFGDLPESEALSVSRTTLVNWTTIDERNRKFVMTLCAESLKTQQKRVQSVGKDEVLQQTLIQYLKAAADHIPLVRGYENGYTVLASPVFRAENGDWAGIPTGAKDRAEKVPVGAELGVSVKVTKKRGKAVETSEAVTESPS